MIINKYSNTRENKNWLLGKLTKQKQIDIVTLYTYHYIHAYILQRSISIIKAKLCFQVKEVFAELERQKYSPKVA